jgi:hypothetical protein
MPAGRQFGDLRCILLTIVRLLVKSDIVDSPKKGHRSTTRREISPSLIYVTGRRERKTKNTKGKRGAQGRTRFFPYALSLSGHPLPSISRQADQPTFVFVTATEARSCATSISKPWYALQKCDSVWRWISSIEYQFARDRQELKALSGYRMLHKEERKQTRGEYQTSVLRMMKRIWHTRRDECIGDRSYRILKAHGEELDRRSRRKEDIEAGTGTEMYSPSRQ